jgi:uncharacterized membrane protein
MSVVEQHIDVAMPVDAVYDQWTRFEELPRFVEGLDEVRLLDDTHLLWRASSDGATVEWTWEVVELRPQERIAWRSTSGITHGGVVSFLRLDDELTRVEVTAEIDSGDPDAVRDQISASLAAFKALMEGR